MKRLLFLAALATFAACQKDPEQSQGAPAASFATVEDAAAAADKVYKTGAPTFYGECGSWGVPAAMMGSYMSGYFVSAAQEGRQLYESCRNLALDDSSVAEYSKSVNTQAREAIALCDDILARIPNTAGLSEAQKDQYTGEARFFRAFNNFYLVRAFGGTEQDYAAIVADLTSAAELLPDEAYAKNGQRAGRPAALVLLADVYLTMSGYPLLKDNYRLAAQAARDVIAGKKHSLLVSGEAPDQSAWNLLGIGADDTETIFSYLPSEADGISLSSFTLPAEADSWGMLKVKTQDACLPARELMALYDTYSDMRSRDGQFFHSFVSYQKENRTIIQTFKSRPRLWFDRQRLFDTGKAGRSVTIYRYAEVLLIAAEAIARSEGVTAEAVGYLADIRSRAFPKMDRAAIAAELSSLTVEEFVEQVWAERVREFPLEMKLWPDIQRTRRYPTTPMKGTESVQFVDILGTIKFVDIAGAKTPADATLSEAKLLMPLPKTN